MRAALLSAGSILAGALLAGCGSAASPAASGGDIEIFHPFLPAPASPSVAAVYLTMRDSSATADRLLSASTPAAQSAQLMTETAEGNSGAMAPLSGVTIPAHGQAALVPGQDHLMLTNPGAKLSVGEKVKVTLHFARAGEVTVSVPVVPMSSVVDKGGMANMPGM